MTATPRFPLHLGVVTHVPHQATGTAETIAYEPYVREMRIWADLFARVTVCAPVADDHMPGSQAAYERRNVDWMPVRYSMSYARTGPLVRLGQVPALVGALWRLARSCDFLLLRSPGHPALFARPIADALRVPHVTKWAGFFGPHDGERLPRRVERVLVTRGRSAAFVYGEHDTPHLIPFPPALMSDAELTQAAALGSERTWAPPWRILAVGRLLDEKGFALALQGLARLRADAPEIAWTFTLVGSGPEEGALRALAGSLGIADRVRFAGALPFADVQREYARAHVAIMPGAREGWPKVIAEAWAHGAVPVGAAGGIVPWILGGKGAGDVFDPTPQALGACLVRLLRAPEALPAMSARGPVLARDLSLETFRRRVIDVLTTRYGLP